MSNLNFKVSSFQIPNQKNTIFFPDYDFYVQAINGLWMTFLYIKSRFFSDNDAWSNLRMRESGRNVGLWRQSMWLRTLASSTWMMPPGIMQCTTCLWQPSKKDITHNRTLEFGIPYLCLVLFYGISDPPHSLEPLSSGYLTQKHAEFT